MTGFNSRLFLGFKRSLERGMDGHTLFSLPSLFLLFSVITVFSVQEQPGDGRVFLSRFGQRYLKEAELVAEVLVTHVYHMGMGVDVTKIKLEHVILNQLPPDLENRKEHLMLGFRQEFIEGTKLLLVLKRFDASDRLVKIYRLSHLEKNYKDKIRLIQEYIRVEEIPDENKRKKYFIPLVLKNLRDESHWVRWNSLHELKGLIEQKKWIFTQGDVAYLEEIEKESKDPAFKGSIASVRETMAEKAPPGPPAVGDQPEKYSEEESFPEREEKKSNEESR